MNQEQWEARRSSWWRQLLCGFTGHTGDWLNECLWCGKKKTASQEEKRAQVHAGILNGQDLETDFQQPIIVSREAFQSECLAKDGMPSHPQGTRIDCPHCYVYKTYYN